MPKHTNEGVLYRHRAKRIKPSLLLRAIMLISELSMTTGVLIGVFLVWSVYIYSPMMGNKQSETANAIASGFLNSATNNSHDAGIPVTERVGDYHDMAVLFVPRFGKDYKRVIRETVDVSRVLNSETAGVGHYPNTAMPGEAGNFAIAGHEVGWGSAFGKVSELQLGDRIYVLTPKGWYIYRYLNSEYVSPDGISVLYPVPQDISASPEEHLLTMTTCNPPFSIDERLIAYSVLEKWQPSNEVPQEIAHLINT